MEAIAYGDRVGRSARTIGGIRSARKIGIIGRSGSACGNPINKTQTIECDRQELSRSDRNKRHYEPIAPGSNFDDRTDPPISQVNRSGWRVHTLFCDKSRQFLTDRLSEQIGIYARIRSDGIAVCWVFRSDRGGGCPPPQIWLTSGSVLVRVNPRCDDRQDYER